MSRKKYSHKIISTKKKLKQSIKKTKSKRKRKRKKLYSGGLPEFISQGYNSVKEKVTSASSAIGKFIRNMSPEMNDRMDKAMGIIRGANLFAASYPELTMKIFKGAALAFAVSQGPSFINYLLGFNTKGFTRNNLMRIAMIYALMKGNKFLNFLKEKEGKSTEPSTEPSTESSTEPPTEPPTKPSVKQPAKQPAKQPVKKKKAVNSRQPNT